MPVWMQRIVEKEAALLKRCYLFFIQPKTEWEQIDKDTPEVSVLFKDTLLFIVAFPAIARLLSWGILDFSEALVHAILWYGLMIGGIWGASKLIGLIAPSFESNPDPSKALSLIFYSFLPFLAGGLLYMVPLLTLLVPIFGLYGLYLLWLGVPVVLNTPDKQRILFTLIIAAVEIFIVLIVGRLTGGLVLSL